MDQNNNPIQQSNQAPPIPEWFIEAATPTPEPFQRPKSYKKKLFLIILASLTVCILGIIFTAVFSNNVTGCLDNKDYSALTGTNLKDPLSPTESFYSDYVLFKPSSTSYDNLSDGGLHGDQLIQKIADFYKERPTKPMTITVNATYTVLEGETVAKQQLASVQSDLRLAGIPDISISTKGTRYVEPEENPVSGADSGEITISITSSPTCR